MPGIHKSRFINIGDNERELSCSVCLGIFVNPMVASCCKHTFCGDCVRESIKSTKKCPNVQCGEKLSNNKLSQPPLFLDDLLNKLKLKCDFSNDGCVEELPYESCMEHTRNCRYNPEAICRECNEKYGPISEHNCVNILCKKYQCIANLRTSNVELETIKEELIVKNSNLETELKNVKIFCVEQSVSFGELNRSSNEARKRSHDCSESVETKKQCFTQSVSIVKETSSQSLPELTTYEQHVNGCGENPETNIAHSMPKLIRYKKHESICDDNRGESNSLLSEHNCFTQLLSRHKCVQNLQTKLMDLEINNKQLIDKNAKLEMQLLNVKKEHDEHLTGLKGLKQLSEKINKLSFSDGLVADKTINELQQIDGQLSSENAMNEKISGLEEKCEKLETEMFNLMKNFGESIKTLNDQLNDRNDLIVKFNCRQVINKEMTDKCNQLRIELSAVKKNLANTCDELKSEQNRYNRLHELNQDLELTNKGLQKKFDRNMLELYDMKNESQQTVSELNEKLSESIETNNQLNHKIELLKKNIDLEKVKLTLKVNDINDIKQHKTILGREVKIRDLWWNLRAKLFLSNSVEYLSLYLVCNNENVESEKWSCVASTELSIEPQNCVDVAHKNVRQFSCVFSDHQNKCGFNNFMPWNVVTGKEYGFVKDNSILLNACVSVCNSCNGFETYLKPINHCITA